MEKEIRLHIKRGRQTPLEFAKAVGEYFMARPQAVSRAMTLDEAVFAGDATQLAIMAAELRAKGIEASVPALEAAP